MWILYEVYDQKYGQKWFFFTISKPIALSMICISQSVDNPIIFGFKGKEQNNLWPSHNESTGFNSITKVKQQWVCLVLR